MRFPFLTKTGWSCITWLWGEWEEGGTGGIKKHRRGIALAAHKDLLGVLDSAIAVFSAENGHPVAGKTNHLQKILTKKVFA